MKNSFSMEEMTPEEREQLRYLQQHVEIRDQRRKEWRSMLFQCEVAFFSIGSPLLLGSGRKGPGTTWTSASLLFCSLAILAGAVSLYAPVRAASDNAARVLAQTKARRYGRVPTSPMKAYERFASAAFPWLSAVSFALMICALVSSFF